VIADEYRDIIEKEIEGSATPEESRRLETYLDAHPEARSFHEEVQRLSRMLHEVKAVEPPGRLKADILRALRTRPQVHDHQPSWFEILVASLRGRAGVRYSLSFGAGAVAALVLLALIVQSPISKPGSDGIAGMMIDRSTLGGLEAVSARILDFGETRGAITTKSDGELVLAEIELSSPHKVDVVLEYPHGLVPRGFEVSPSDMEVSLGETQARFVHRGEGQYTFFLESATGSPSSLTIRLSTGEGSFDGTLEAVSREDS
jgi:hypothetical protein